MLHEDGIQRHHDRRRILDDDSRRDVRFLNRKIIEIIRPCNPAYSHKEKMRYIAHPERKAARIRDEEENRKNDKRNGNARLNDDERRVLDIKEMFNNCGRSAPQRRGNRDEEIAFQLLHDGGGSPASSAFTR